MAIALVAATGCRPTAIQSGPRVRIAIGGPAQLVYLPTTLADRLGYYREEGLEVELQDFAGGSKALEALLGGSADVVSGFFDHTIQMAVEDRPMLAFVSMLRYPGLALVVSPAARREIRSVKDLAGENVGVSAPGSSTHMLLNHLLAREGVAATGVSAIGVGMAAGAVAAMESGKVAAAIMAEPAISQLRERKGELRILADTRTAEGVRAVYGVETYPAAVLYSHRAWVEANGPVVQRLARAIVRTLAWIQQHTPEEIAAQMPEAFQAGNAALYARSIAASKAIYSPDGVMAPEAARAVAGVLAETMEKVRARNPDAAQCYTNEFVRRR